MNISQLSVEQLERAIDLKRQIAALESQLGRILEGSAVSTGGFGTRRKMSAAGRARIAAAARARWARFRTAHGKPATPAPKKYKMSAASRAKIAAAARARWARARAAKQ